MHRAIRLSIFLHINLETWKSPQEWAYLTDGATKTWTFGYWRCGNPKIATFTSVLYILHTCSMILTALNIEDRFSWELLWLFAVCSNSSSSWVFVLCVWVQHNSLESFHVCSWIFLNVAFPYMTNPKSPRNMNGTDVYLNSCSWVCTVSILTGRGVYIIRRNYTINIQHVHTGIRMCSFTKTSAKWYRKVPYI